MCGFVGVVRESGFELPNLEPLLSLLKYRGPDSTNVKTFVFASYKMAVGFNRLAIQDLSPSADQPFSKHQITILFNGEIYNKYELQKELQLTSDVRFETNSDTEVLLDLYNNYGIEFLNKVRGMFAIVIVDHRLNQIYLARDRFGIKPLYFTSHASGVSFASDIRSIHALIDKREVNMSFFERRILLDPFVGHNNDAPFTNIRSLEPGTYVCITNDLRLIETRYYDLSMVATEYVTPPNEAIRELFTHSVIEHLVSDVPVGAALSGGFDSSLISVIASRALKQIKMFSIRIGETNNESLEDLYYGDVVFDSINHPQKQRILTSVEKPVDLELIDELVGALGAPLYDQRAFVWDSLYQGVKQENIKVLLNGQGADELWYGYYPKLAIWNWFSVLYHEELSVQTVENYVRSANRQSALYGKLAIPDEQITKYSIDIFNSIVRQTDEQDNKKMLTLFMVNTVLRALLNFEDVFSMRHSVEVRVPFLDHRFVELALKIPEKEHLAPTYRGKDLLKRVFDGHIPRPVIERTKSPLPKARGDNQEIKRLFLSYLPQIKAAPLVKELYKLSELDNLATQAESEFYGGSGEAMLQILSTWRFAEVFNV